MLHLWGTSFVIAEVIPHFAVLPGLTSAIFIVDMFHTIAEASLIIFDLSLQFFPDAKIFELERLRYPEFELMIRTSQFVKQLAK